MTPRSDTTVPPIGTPSVLYVTAVASGAVDAGAFTRCTDSDSHSAVVAQLRRSTAVTVVPPDMVDDRLRTNDVDCVVCTHTDTTDGLSVVRTVEDVTPDVPVVLWTDDSSAVTDALRAGVTDAIPAVDGAPPSEVLVDRVHDAVSTAREAAWHRELVENTGGGVVVHDCETSDILTVNRRLCELIGADPAARDDLELQDIVAGTDAFTEASARDIVSQAATEGKLTFDWLNETVDGELFWVDVTLEPIEFRGDRYIVGSVTGEDVRTVAGTREGFRTTLERVDDAFFALDANWRFTYLNTAAEELLGVDSVDTLGTRLRDSSPELVESATEQVYYEAIDTQESQSLKHWFDAFDSWYHMTVYPTDDGLSVFLRDVTTSHEREQVPRRLLDTTRELMTAESRQAVADTVSEATDSILGFDVNGVRLYDADHDRLEMVTTTARTRDLVGELPPVDGGGVIFETFASGEPTIVDDIRGRTELPDERYAPLRSFMILPLGNHGVISVGAREEGAFDDEDCALGQLLAANATDALDRVARQRDLKRYKRVIEALDELVFAVDDDGDLQFVSDSLAERLGVNASELDGEPVCRLFGRELADEVDTHLVESVSGDAIERTFETTLDAADCTEELAVEVELSMGSSGSDMNGAVGIVRDISELTATRDRLTTEEQHFQYLFENLPDPVDEVVFDEGVPVIYAANSAFERTFGADEDVVGRPVHDVLTADTAERLPPEVSHIPVDGEDVEGTISSGEFRCRTHDGPRDFQFERIGFTLDGVPHAFGVYFDVTERKQRERYLTLVNRVLRHNLRNDMNVLLGYASQLQREVDDPDLAARAASISDIACDLTSAVNDARTLEEMVGNPVDSDATVDLAALTREVLDDGEFPSVDVRLPDTAPVFGTSRLGLAIEHLVDNAIEHADSDSPEIRVSAETPDAEGPWTELRVMDDGPGIPETERAVVTGELDATPLAHGSGLGLWLVKTVTESLGGELAFEPSPLGGAGVVLRLRSAA